MPTLEKVILKNLSSRGVDPNSLFSKVLRTHKDLREQDVRDALWVLVSKGNVVITPSRQIRKHVTHSKK